MSIHESDPLTDTAASAANTVYAYMASVKPAYYRTVEEWEAQAPHQAFDACMEGIRLQSGEQVGHVALGDTEF